MLFWLLMLNGNRDFHSHDEAMLNLFPQHTQKTLVWGHWDQVPVTLKRQLEADPELRDARLEGEFEVYAVSKEHQFLGWTVLTEEFGKHQPMTIMVAIRPDYSVSGALLVTFRENRGYGIKHPKFQKQFNDKTTNDPIEVGIDIVHVSGSTISSRAMALGVRKALRVVAELNHAGYP